MRPEASPAHPRRATAASRKPTAGPCSSTSSAPCRSPRRTAFFAPWNMARSRASARPSQSRSTCALSRRPTRTFRRRSRRALFRADLLDRLSFEVVTLPPLRARNGDIPLLVDHFGRRMAVELEWPNWPGFSPRALAELEAYNWPGNVRELRNVVERAVYRWEDPERAVEAIQFDPFHSPWAPSGTVQHAPTSKPNRQSSPRRKGRRRRHRPYRRAISELPSPTMSARSSRTPSRPTDSTSVRPRPRSTSATTSSGTR